MYWLFCVSLRFHCSSRDALAVRFELCVLDSVLQNAALFDTAHFVSGGSWRCKTWRL